VKNQPEKGTAIVEFAIVFPLLLLIVLGIMQISLIFVAQTVVEYAAFAAARAELVEEDPLRAAAMVCSAIAGPTDVPPAVPDAPASITVPGWGELPRSADALDKTLVEVSDPLDDDNDQIVVTVTHNYELIIPVASMLFKLVSAPAEPGQEPEGLFVTLNGAPHMVLRSQHTRPVPWANELDDADEHPDIPHL